VTAAAAIEANAAEVEALVADWGPPFCDGWERFRPVPVDHRLVQPAAGEVGAKRAAVDLACAPGQCGFDRGENHPPLSTAPRRNR